MVATAHILRVPTREIGRAHGRPRWCFGCRQYLPGDLVVLAPVAPMSYYGPHSEYRCDGCGEDRRLGFGFGWEGEA